MGGGSLEWLSRHVNGRHVRAARGVYGVLLKVPGRATLGTACYGRGQSLRGRRVQEGVHHPRDAGKALHPTDGGRTLRDGSGCGDLRHIRHEVAQV